MTPFGRWLPDRFLLGQNLASDAKGVIPSPDGYIPWLQPVAASAALAAACSGAFLARTTADSLVTFASTSTKIYKFTDATTWTDVTRASGGNYNVPTDELTSFTQYGTQIIASDVNDVLQTIDVDAGTNFAAVAGSPPQARICRTVGDFIMLAGLTSNPNRIQWCGRNNSAFWTPGTQDCDYQDFPDGGETTGIAPFGLGRGLILQEAAIRVYQATNDRSIFNFQPVDVNRGLIAPDSLVVLGGVAYGLSEQGFFASDGTGPAKGIGADMVDKWFQGQVNRSRISAVRGAADPLHQRIFWLFPTNGNAATVLDMCICFDILNNAWTYAPVNGTVLLGSAAAGYTIDNIGTLLTDLGYTLETAPFSFDSRFLLGGAAVLAVFDDNFKLSFFSGNPMAANMETANFQPIPSQRAFVRGCRPIADTSASQITIGTSENIPNFMTDVTFGSPSSQNAQGICPVRASGRWFRARMSIPVNTTWTHASAISFDDDNPATSMVTPAGGR